MTRPPGPVGWTGQLPSLRVAMTKTLPYRLFGIGALPRTVRRALEKEGIAVEDEGMPSRLISRDPGTRGARRKQSFSGSIAVTRRRLVAYAGRRRQINIGNDDAQIKALYVNTRDRHTLSIAFESSVFRDDRHGFLEFRFHTNKALRFKDAIRALGAHDGEPPER